MIVPPDRWRPVCLPLLRSLLPLVLPPRRVLGSANGKDGTYPTAASLARLVDGLRTAAGAPTSRGVPLRIASASQLINSATAAAAASTCSYSAAAAVASLASQTAALISAAQLRDKASLQPAIYQCPLRVPRP